jgi:Nif-specific regulatory protein
VNPRLFAVSGPLKDSVFDLPANDLTLGRDPGNGLPISDPSVSRKHCLIFSRDQRYGVRDLNSRNGTQVNGESIRERWLNHGDQIGVGDSIFRFLTELDQKKSDQVEFEENSVTHATAEIRPQDVLYLQPERILSELPTTSRLARNLNALLQISRVVHAIQDLEKLQDQILSSLFEVAPAERGAILLGGKEPGNFESVFARHRDPRIEKPLRVSRTIARDVMGKGLAVLGSDVMASSALGQVASIVASQTRSLLCVPLVVFQRLIGCIYLDTSSLARRFDKDDLELVTAVAGVCSFALENASRLRQLELENQRLSTEVAMERSLVGDSAKMREVFQFLGRVAQSDANVLIYGESGTGKELAARAIHRRSSRSGKPFVAINCAAIPETLLESELFGHEKGAFTGATGQRKGRLETADSGVVFLDEIGELEVTLQVKLLRVLQEREFERLGGTRPIKVDIRVIAATNRNLEEAVKEGAFRQDLFFRLNVVKLTMPALRDRKEDIPLLASFFVQKHLKGNGGKQKQVSREALALLANYDWPGNVRELENVIERALVLGASDDILPEDLPEALIERGAGSGEEARYHTAIKELKKKLIKNALEDASGNFTDAARSLGVHPNYLHRLIRNLEMRDSLPRGGKGPGANE